MSTQTKRVRLKLARLNTLIRDNGIKMDYLCPLLEDKRSQEVNPRNCRRIWKYGKDKAEVEKARRFLIPYQRREWLFSISRELEQWGFFNKKVKCLNEEVREDEAESKSLLKAKKRRTEKIKLRHKVACQILGYDDCRRDEGFC